MGPNCVKVGWYASPCGLTSLQQRLVKTGGRLIKHARYYWLLLAESHLTRQLFRHAAKDHDAAVAGG
jgi:hypothetical protein